MTNLDSILKSRDITLPTKVHLVKDMAFPVVMYGCESSFYMLDTSVLWSEYLCVPKIMASGPITSWENRWGNSGNSLFF